MITEQIALGITLFLKLFTIWLVVTSAFFWKPLKARTPSQPKTRFACLIAARNEETVIGQIVESLKAQDYPDELYDVFVIPNNCTDRTEDAARRAGAKILPCFAPVRCKGDALRQAISQLLYQKADPSDPAYDAFCVFDADNVVDSRYLSEMNDAFAGGTQVAKARMFTKNPYDSWVSGCYALYHGFFEALYNRSRAAIGLSAKLVGTGFAVHRDVLISMGGWRTETLAEDAEFASFCSERGIRVDWVPEAITYDEAPTSFRLSLTQRRRWISGIVSVGRCRIPRLAGTAWHRSAGRWLVLDNLVFLLLPYIQIVGLIPQILLLGMIFSSGRLVIIPETQNRLAEAAGSISGYPLIFIFSLVTAYAAVILFGLLIMILSDRRGGFHSIKLLKALVFFPLFMVSWLPLTYLAFCKKTTSWKEIRHSVVIPPTDSAPAR